MGVLFDKMKVLPKLLTFGRYSPLSAGRPPGLQQQPERTSVDEEMRLHSVMKMMNNNLKSDEET